MMGPGRDVRPRGLGTEVLARPYLGVLSLQDSKAGGFGVLGEMALPDLELREERFRLA